MPEWGWGGLLNTAMSMMWFFELFTAWSDSSPRQKSLLKRLAEWVFDRNEFRRLSFHVGSAGCRAETAGRDAAAQEEMVLWALTSFWKFAETVRGDLDSCGAPGFQLGFKQPLLALRGWRGASGLPSLMSAGTSKPLQAHALLTRFPN